MMSIVIRNGPWGASNIRQGTHVFLDRGSFFAQLWYWHMLWDFAFYFSRHFARTFGPPPNVAFWVSWLPLAFGCWVDLIIEIHLESPLDVQKMLTQEKSRATGRYCCSDHIIFHRVGSNSVTWRDLHLSFKLIFVRSGDFWLHEWNQLYAKVWSPTYIFICALYMRSLS